MKDGKTELCTKMSDYVKKRGKIIVINPEKDKTMVQVFQGAVRTFVVISPLE